MDIIQKPNQIIDIAIWRKDPEFSQYPEGARDKTLLYSPSQSPYPFIKADHRYLFKLSTHRHPEQFWTEIVAYLIGVEMEIPVPPAFVAYDSTSQCSGALIEWFYNENENYIPGGDYLQRYISNFDRKKGKKHNFQSIISIFTDLTTQSSLNQINWLIYWAKTFVFDALIGNTDRHQDNWGIINIASSETPDQIRIAPVFDNGTSMGYEIFEKNFKNFETDHQLKNYTDKGWHHMRWDLFDVAQMKHIALLKKLVDVYPETRFTMIECLAKINEETFRKIFQTLSTFNVSIKLTPNRADFMLRLLIYRHKKIMNELTRPQ